MPCSRSNRGATNGACWAKCSAVWEIEIISATDPARVVETTVEKSSPCNDPHTVSVHITSCCIMPAIIHWTGGHGGSVLSPPRGMKSPVLRSICGDASSVAPGATGGDELFSANCDVRPRQALLDYNLRVGTHQSGDPYPFYWKGL